ncbi:glycosyltransferase [Pseudoroseomonas ludipueritiae]|uniref:Glycosyltransferase n=1 Tax=Pseudoroseomonas ludipueritiae TaxID=198093 RepID=A0ABR7REY9_9PROT|nr:glycosyltransferase [Pseudoroseomonas ludipueritiae]MBC9180286.1 glycosyltransferase [Pseudoroseomonas ludipueritiae]
MSKRRVLHVLKYYRPSFTGEGVFLERSSAVMQELAPDVEHDLLVTETPSPAEPPAACSTLRRVFYLTRKPRGTVAHHVALVGWFLRNLRHYDTVHIRTHVDWYFLTYLLSALAGRRLVISATLDDSVPVLVGNYRASLRPLVQRGFKVFDAFVSISPKLFRETSASGVDPARCHLVPCGISLPQAAPGERGRIRAELGIGAEDPVLLFVGGLCVRKDPRFLIDAMPAILAKHPRARLLLVGPELEAEYVAGMRQAVAAAGMEQAVFFLGEQLNPHPYFEAADMLAFASRLEGFGTVVPEGMAHGLPVVVRHLPGVNDDFVLDGETGYLFNDEAGFLQAADRLAGDPALRRRIGAAARHLATTRFGMRQVAARYLGIYGFADRVADAPEAQPTGLGCTASIADRRFHTPVAPTPDPTPLLLTTVDAEEAFDWSDAFSRTAADVSSMRSQHLAHRVFSRHGVVPLYMADYPVVAQDIGCGPLRELLQDGLCDIGAQMHPWVTPPFAEDVCERNSYAGNLPVSLELAKARHLTEVISEKLGITPRIYRTGRYGFGPRTADILKSLGYVADSSLAPCWPTPARHDDPAAWASAPGPYWVDKDQTLMEIPVSAALVGHLAGWREEQLACFAFHPRRRHRRVAGALSRLGLLERIRLTPEGMTVPEAKRLVRHMLAHGHRVFTLTYHSPSLEPGNTPYVRDLAQRDRFLDWLDEFYTFFREEAGGRNATWQEVRFGAATAQAGGLPGGPLERPMHALPTGPAVVPASRMP